MARGSEVKERLFGDFDLNENLVAACTDVVAKQCQDQFANGEEGAVIECLMDLRTETDDIDANDDAQNTGKVNKECAEEVRHKKTLIWILFIYYRGDAFLA